jgi:transcriptional regulator with XRE-family HTH domain
MLLTRLKYWREHQGLSLRQLADKSKVPYSAISLLENGKREPQGRTVHKLAAALEVDVTALYEQAPAQPVSDNKTITPIIEPARSTRARAKKQAAPAPVSSFWVVDEDDTFGPFAQPDAERLKGKLDRARVYEAASRSEASQQHIQFKIRVLRGHDAW